MASTDHGSDQAIESFRTVVEIAGVPIYILDRTGQFTYVNAALSAQAGYDRASLVGEHVSVLLCEQDVDRCQAVVRELLETGRRSSDLTVTARDASDRRLTANLSIALLPLDHGYRGSVGVVRSLSPASDDSEADGQTP
ncbi:MAG: PAS domain S-box protein [Halorientalis sp.]